MPRIDQKNSMTTVSALIVTEKYAVASRAEEGRDDYIAAHPQTGLLVARETLESPWCHEPTTRPLEEARELAERFTRETGKAWVVQLAPNPCPSCGRVIWADDHDFCYPLNREYSRWTAGCNEHDFGCGHEVE